MRQQTHRRVTIKQVARQVGVSTQTVSRVLNDRPDVAPETRQRVLACIEQLGYRPSALARSLIRQRSNTLGVVTAGLKYIGPSYTLSGITEQAEASGYSLLLKELPKFTTDEVEPILNSLLSMQVDGIIWAVSEVGNNRDWLHDEAPRLPVPILFLTTGPREGFSVVSADNYSGGRMATEHLLSLGRQQIGHVAGPLAWWEAHQRKVGWQDAMRGAGRDVSDVQITEGNWSAASGECAFEELLAQYPTIDAVFVGNDQMALSVLQVAHRRGISVPDDLAVVGFDGIAEAAYFWPSLTTVWPNPQKLGCMAVEEIIRMIEALRQSGAEPAPKTIQLEPQLIVRGSTVPG
jgi:LacI family transcriptional regulator